MTEHKTKSQQMKEEEGGGDASSATNGKHELLGAKVVFLLGGPGSGKGTLCDSLLAAKSDVAHVCAGQLLRAEVQKLSQTDSNAEGTDLTLAHTIENTLKEGKIVPGHITVQLLRNAMEEAIAQSSTPINHFLIDGFPRELSQAILFEETVAPCECVIYLDCDNETMNARLGIRSVDSGRSDDNATTIVKRFNTWVNTCLPVVEMYRGRGLVKKIDARHDRNEVLAETLQYWSDHLTN